MWKNPSEIEIFDIYQMHEHISVDSNSALITTQEIPNHLKDRILSFEPQDWLELLKLETSSATRLGSPGATGTVYEDEDDNSVAIKVFNRIPRPIDEIRDSFACNQLLHLALREYPTVNPRITSPAQYALFQTTGISTGTPTSIIMMERFTGEYDLDKLRGDYTKVYDGVVGSLLKIGVPAEHIEWVINDLDYGEATYSADGALQVMDCH